MRFFGRPGPLSRTFNSRASPTCRDVTSISAAIAARGDGVADAVLDERLQQQVGHERVQRVGVEVVAHGEPLAEAGLLDLQVLGQELEVVAERHLLRAAAVERHPEQVAQPHQHAVGGVHVPVHERRDAVQGVEEEVRVELSLQRLQLRFGKPRLELRGAEGAVLRLAEVRGRVAERDDGAHRSSSPSRSP